MIESTNDTTIYPFKFKHLKDLKDLLESNNYHNAHLITMKNLPKIGYIAYLGKIPIAAGFLRRLEPCYAQIDTLCTNKYFGGKLRHIGIKTIVDILIADAKRLKLEGLVCHTKHADIVARAKLLGFHEIDEKIIALPLK